MNQKIIQNNNNIKYYMNNKKIISLYSGSNNNTRVKNIRANINTLINKDKTKKNDMLQKKQKINYNTGSMFSLLNKKYNLAKETKKNYYDPINHSNNIKLAKKNSNFRKKGKPIPNASNGSLHSLSRVINRRITNTVNENIYIN